MSPLFLRSAMAIPVTSWVVCRQHQGSVGHRAFPFANRAKNRLHVSTLWGHMPRADPMGRLQPMLPVAGGGMGDWEMTDIAKQITNELVDRLSPSRTTSLKISRSGTSMAPLPTRPLVTTPTSTCALAPSIPTLSAAHPTSLFSRNAGMPMGHPTSTTSAMTV